MSVRLHIEQLVVDGISIEPRERPALGDAVERGLVLLLSDRASRWPTNTVEIPRVYAPPLRCASSGAPVLGAAIAGSIHDGIAAAFTR